MELRDFINAYPNFKDCAIQTFDDNYSRKAKELANKFHVSKINRKEVKRLNTEGAGIFFSVNSMEVGKRDKSSVSNINTRIVECDKLSKEEQMLLIDKAPIRPSCVIESNKSYHIYYFAVDGDIESYETIGRGLIEYYQGDNSLSSDYARVLRLPGTLHQKDINNPFTIKCLRLEQSFYTKEQMMKCFPYVMPEKKEHPQVNITKARNIWEIMGLQSSRYMLGRLSNSRLVNGESIDFRSNSNGTDQIFVNGNSTGARIDNNDYIGSSQKGGPTWIQWVTYYGNSKADIYKWFIEFCGDLIPKEFDRSKQMQELDKIKEEENEEKRQELRKSNFRHISYADKIDKSIIELVETDPSKVMKRGREERDSLLGGIYGGKIYLIGAETGQGKSTFVNQVVKNLSSAGVRVTRYSLEDRLEDSGKEDIYYMTNQYRYKMKKPTIERIKFVNGEYTYPSSPLYSDDICDDIGKVLDIIKKLNVIDLDKSKDVSISDLTDLMEEECDKGTRVFVIDHLHYFSYGDSKERMDLQIENAMKRINEIARKRDVAVFLVAHYSSKGVSEKTSINSFKGSSAIKQIANIVIQITRDEEDNITTFVISKIRGPIKKRDINAMFDIEKYEYSFTKTQEQKEKEAKNRI